MLSTRNPNYVKKMYWLKTAQGGRHDSSEECLTFCRDLCSYLALLLFCEYNDPKSQSMSLYIFNKLLIVLS